LLYHEINLGLEVAMTDRKQTTLKMGDSVSGYPDRQAGISWPLPVDAKLEDLLKAARDVGERTSRREIAAAIIAMTELSGERLSDLLRRYRLARVKDVLQPSDTSNVVEVEFTPYGPGPRRREYDRHK
jgi:hypothetical protein